MLFDIERNAVWHKKEIKIKRLTIDNWILGFYKIKSERYFIKYLPNQLQKQGEYFGQRCGIHTAMTSQ